MAKILIVDDEKLLVTMYKTALEAGGFQVETAGDGKEGLKKSNPRNPISSCWTS